MRTRLASLAALAGLATAGLLAPTAAFAGNPAGNNGTVKIDGTDADANENNPHVGCTFIVEWYGFDKGSDIISDVTFESWAPTADAKLTVDGQTKVFVGADDASGGGSLAGLDGRETYTLHFVGTPQAQQGFHVKMTVNTPGSNGADKKSKVFWVQGCDDTTTDPTDPGDTTDPTDPGDTTDPTDPGDTTDPTDPGDTTDPTDPGDTTDPGQPTKPFDWDWTYADPGCAALGVDYPADIPDGQANDVNVRLETNVGQVNLNFHNNTGFWGGTTDFGYLTHPSWPAGVTSYRVVWTQVGGTNYHWQGSVECTIVDGKPVGRTVISDFRTATVSVPRGSSAPTDNVVLEQADDAPVILQTLVAGRWVDVKTVVTDAVDARVTFPKQTRKGTFQYRLAVPSNSGITGTTTKAFTVKVF
ncbi:hypothetical protein [Nocardioides sp. LS1]|uniref:hypothetical protein n=1 Tax=Nocardioides sp. LS1 TaxID=1027620 RepID=UPI000F61CDED|nr:hypothetical protein [Nocardioides sp. LS1]GCD90912.1 hypothetical protein NLS1_29180 [Nocardioides sp. LS1]